MYPAGREPGMPGQGLERGVAWLLVLGLIAKFALASSLPLFGDEAFYWLEAQHLAAAFDDVPAATPWLIALGTALGGDHPQAVRAPFLLLGLLTLAALVGVARELGQTRWAPTALLALLLPLALGNGLLALPDVPLNLAFVLCLWALLRLQRGAPQAGWLLAGGLALGWLSHYRFVVPLAAAGLVLLISADGRRLLRLPALWWGGLIGNLLGLAPLLWQQWQAGGAGFAFQFRDRHPWSLQWEPLADPLLQALLTTPLLYLALLAAALWGVRSERPPALRLAALIGASVLLLYWGLGLFADSERSRLHWPLPGYLALLPVLAALWGTRPEWRNGLFGALGLAALGCIAAGGYLALAAVAPVRLAASDAYPHNFAGWGEIAEAVNKQLPAGPGPHPLLADNFMLAAQLQFALGPRVRVYSLDHPLNRKHGRAGELRRMQRDADHLPTASAERPLLIVAEESASRLRQRPAWMLGLCRRFPAAATVQERLIDHGRKRLLIWRDRGGDQARCLPPALGYLDSPRWGEPLRGGQPVQGWVLRGVAGVRAVRLRGPAGVLALDYGRPLPSLAAQLGNSGDPQMPAVGFTGVLPADWEGTSGWLRLEAQDAEGWWTPVLSLPVGAE